MTSLPTLSPTSSRNPAPKHQPQPVTPSQTNNPSTTSKNPSSLPPLLNTLTQNKVVPAPLALHLACRKNNVEKALDLIKSNPELILTKDSDGRLPLHCAAIRNANWNVIEALVIPHKDTIFAKDNNGKTPLALANQYFADENILISLNEKR